TIVAVDVSNGLAVLRSCQANYHSRYTRATAAVGHLAGYVAKGRRGSVKANAKNCASATSEVIETTVGSHVEIYRVRDSRGEGGVCTGGWIESANPAGTKLRVEILPNIIDGKVYRGRIIERSSSDGAARGCGTSMTIAKQRIAKICV